MRKFIHTKAFFFNEDSSNISGKDEFEIDDFSFDISSVIAYNRSEFEGRTSIRLTSGFSISVNIDYLEMDKKINEYYLGAKFN